MNEELVAVLIALRRASLIAIGITLAAYVVMLICAGRLEATGRGTRLAGLFVGLGGRSLVHLSAAWVKFAFFTAVLLTARPAELCHYLVLAGLCALTLLLAINHLDAWLTEAMSAALIAVGFWVGSNLLNYLREIRFDRDIQIAYWLLTAFLILCSAALFLREVLFISGERIYFDEKGEAE